MRSKIVRGKMPPPSPRNAFANCPPAPKSALAKTAPQATPIKPAPVADIGRLNEARELFGQKKFADAWAATLTAIGKRPLHPEAYLLLAEIALAAGAGKAAKLCAQRAREFAPGWSPVKQFLSKPLKGETKPEWLVLPEEIRNPQSAIRNASPFA